MTLDWNRIKHVHCIGIGGVGISALAHLLLHQGKTLSGTEDNQSPETLNSLREQGVSVSLSLDPTAVPLADCYIYSDAWLTKHTEVLEEAKTRGVPVLSYFEALGSIAAQYTRVIAVAGAHGKTTTTAMLTDVLERGGLDPTAIVGSLRTKTKSNFRAGGSEFFVIEADEYRRHFLNFTPYILLINNIDADHLDYYRDLADIQSAFAELAHIVPKDGYVVCDTTDPAVVPILAGVSATVVDYKPYIDQTLPLKVLPLHRMNAAGVLAIAALLHIDEKTAKEALAEFTGTWRRFEYKGVMATGAAVYDDYGHHPKEVVTTLKSVREQFPHRRLVVVFQPHLYSRTKLLFEEFVSAFGDADEIIVAPIFAAREGADESISNHTLADRIRLTGKPVQAFDSLDAIKTYLEGHTHPQDIVLTMGAGNVYTVGEALVQPI